MTATRAPRTVRAPSLLAAFVLHRYDWSESSLVLDVFTRELGRVPVVAKGAKRPYSQLRPVLLPFQRLQMALVRGAKADGEEPPADTGAEVRTLRSAEWAGGQAMLTGAAIFSGFYLNELLMKLLARQDPHPELFDAYAASLPGLADPDDAVVQAALRAFELTLMARTGVLPDLSLVTTTQQAVRLDAGYALVAEAGVVPARAGDVPLQGDVLIGLQAALEHGSLPALQLACTRALPALRVQLRGLLHYHLGSHTLRTRQVMLGVQSLE